MTAQSVAIGPTTKSPSRGGMFLGFRTALRKELTEWLRGPKLLIVAGVSILGAIFMTLIPFIAQASDESRGRRSADDGSDHQRPDRLDRSDGRAHRHRGHDVPALERTRPRNAGLEPDQPCLADEHHRRQVRRGYARRSASPRSSCR